MNISIRLVCDGSTVFSMTANSHESFPYWTFARSSIKTSHPSICEWQGNPVTDPGGGVSGRLAVTCFTLTRW